MQALRGTFLALAAACAALVATGCQHEYQPLQAHDVGKVLELGGKKVIVEVADKSDTRQLGLMHRKALPTDHGMLFVYPAPRILNFWMRNTAIPLSIAFIEELPEGKGRIVNIDDMEPFDETGHAAHAPVRLALEMTQGWFAAHGVKAGDTIDLPSWIGDLVPGEDA